ncbi:chaperone modulator CbpM [Brackiella oedipodis]|uniref:chaperone modulator CbpM n=1 Tax=Brackiella oedipodis TaxID=124225 RepID=UPI00048AC3A2|nr:chaperone modulator CbpM [Brackiella oedipodis]
MTQISTEAIWLNQDQVCSLQHIVEVSGLTEPEVISLADAGVLPMVDTKQSESPYVFYSECMVTATKARRLRDDFELQGDGLSLVLQLLDRIEELQRQIRLG